jgi:hypothetical protein
MKWMNANDVYSRPPANGGISKCVHHWPIGGLCHFYSKRQEEKCVERRDVQLGSESRPAYSRLTTYGKEA